MKRNTLLQARRRRQRATCPPGGAVGEAELGPERADAVEVEHVMVIARPVQGGAVRVLGPLIMHGAGGAHG